MSDNFKRTNVIGAAEHGNDYNCITNIKVRIARRQPVLTALDPRGHRQFYNPKAKAYQAFVVVFEKPVVLIQGVIFKGADNRVRAHEPGNIVDVAIRVVTSYSFMQPKNVRDTKIFLKVLLDRSTT